MHKGRLEAFSDGVLAIIITIMVLELKVPHGTELKDLLPLLPTFLSYALSFIYVGIYWNNHHHLLQMASRVNGRVLWANNFLLFCISLIPFATAWAGENHFDSAPVALYGVALLLCAIAYSFLVKALENAQGADSKLREAMAGGKKEMASTALYFIAIGTAFWKPGVALLCYVIVAAIWVIPDSRVEKRIA